MIDVESFVGLQMSIWTFTENVINLAVEHCLIYHISDIFTTGKVCEMSDDRLKQLAEESEELRQERESIHRHIKDLKEALDMIRRHRPRVIPGECPATQLYSEV
jgi:uncharacterized coiled-coil DUF342 family protein